MPIQKLSNLLISRIAAGEVIERPASVVKELVENSIDAAADEIIVKIEHGGRNLISVKDNGQGIAKTELNLALTRHATSKISSANLLEINSLGFRGEGLASIASIAKLKLSSKLRGQDLAYEITSIAGKNSAIKASNLTEGTLITISDLFFATPARLKFLKTEKTETNYIIELLRKIALVQPQISFTLSIDGKNYFTLAKTNSKERIAEIMGKDFINNAEAISEEVANYKFSGFTSVPTFNRATAQQQYIFVNNRPIKDKIIYNAIKTAYQDYLARDRHAVIILFITLPAQEIDVNVHPTKAEIRFRDAQKLRSNLIFALKNTIEKTGFRASTETSSQAIAYMQQHDNLLKKQIFSASNKPFITPKTYPHSSTSRANQQQAFRAQESSAPNIIPNNLDFAPQSKDYQPEINDNYIEYPLGSALAQLHKTYIIAQTKAGLVIIDQHAAHERIVYEQLKKALANKNIVRQKLLFSEIVELTAESLNILLDNQDKLADYGIIIEKFGAKAVIIKEIAEIFKELNLKNFIQDLADSLLEYGEAINLLEKLTEIYGNYACHHAIRAGRELNISEMNDILRKMENTAFSGQCNHGRPTYVELKKHNLEKLFGRK